MKNLDFNEQEMNLPHMVKIVQYIDDQKQEIQNSINKVETSHDTRQALAGGIRELDRFKKALTKESKLSQVSTRRDSMSSK
jgi:transcription initiation factor IIF auxiliary subunit